MSDVGPGTRCNDGPAAEACADVVAIVDPFGGGAPDPLTFPRIPQHLVPRPRQMQRLGRMAGLTIIEALPGFGKTTLAAGWAREQAARGARVVWIQAAEDLDQPAAFAEHLHRGLLRAGALGDATVAPATGASERRWVAELARCSAPVIVVVDDAHHLRDAALLDGLLRLIAVAHPLHVVVCCDTEHAFHDAAERHGVETNTLRGADLGVVPDLVPAFARSWGHELDDAAAQALHRLVGGWLLPLRLVLDETPPAADAFATEAAKDFLARRVVPHLADTADRGGASLGRLGLLLPRSEGDPAGPRVPELLRAALLDAKGRGGTADQLRGARAAKDWPELERLWIEEGWALAGGDADAFQAGYAGLPPSVTRSHEGLLLVGVLADALAATAPDLHWLLRAETMLRHYREAGADLVRGPERQRSPVHQVELLTAAMVARRTEGRLTEARRIAAEAGVQMSRALHDEPETVRSAQAAWCKLQSAVTQLLCGDLGGAVDLATASYQTGPSSIVGSGAAGFLAMTHAISGQTAEARQWLSAHDEVDIEAAWAAGLARFPARLARAMLAMDELDAGTAEAELAAAPLGTDANGLWPLALLAHTRFALLFGDPTSMLARLHHIGRVSAHQMREQDAVPREIYERCLADLALAVGDANRAYATTGDGHDASRWLCAPAARLQLLGDDPSKAMHVASAAVWRHDLRTRDRQELLVVLALASRATGHVDQALDSFRRAHALARDTGNLEPFLLMTPEVRGELLAATGLSFRDDARQRLDAARPVYPCAVDLVRLSPRELEVLRRLPHHETAAALARHLSVSVNTVKKQLGSLYAKLGAGNRSAALLRAQQLGLLDSSPAGNEP